MKPSLPLFKLVFTRAGKTVNEHIVRDTDGKSAFEYGKKLCRKTGLRVRAEPFARIPE